MAGAINSAEQRLVDEARRVIVTSRYMVQQLSEQFAVSEDRVDVIPNGVDAARFGTVSDTSLESFRERFARPEEKIVLSVGRIEYQKGLHTLVEAAPAVLASHPNTRFVIAGRGSQLPELRRRAEQLGLTSAIQFTGFISDDDRDRLYMVADAAVFPSLYEPFGIVALEAMAAGCPVVVGDVGGLAEIVRCCETGMTVYPGNPESVAWGIRKVLTDPASARDQAAAAYQRVREEYNWDRIGSLTVASYERTVRGRAR
jgi:glycosyltransferase involved in cell wall biosynthesis